VFLFGLFALGVLAGMAFPSVHDQLVQWIEQATTTGPVGTASDTLKAGDIWLGTWQIFSHNYLVTVVVALLSLVFPPLILFVFGIQFFAFGIIFPIPGMLNNPVMLIPLMGTLLLEGRHVIAFCHLGWSGRHGHIASAKSHLPAYGQASSITEALIANRACQLHCWGGSIVLSTRNSNTIPMSDQLVEVAIRAKTVYRAKSNSSLGRGSHGTGPHAPAQYGRSQPGRASSPGDQHGRHCAKADLIDAELQTPFTPISRY
jgi:hypothetical protein